MKKKAARLVAAVLCLAFLLGGCGGKGSDKESGTVSVGGSEGTGSGGRKEIVVWSLWPNSHNAILQQMLDKFNAGQDKYSAKYVTMGGAGEMRNKITQLKSEEWPSIICGQPQAVGFYDQVYDASGKKKIIKPIQDFIDADSDKWTDKIYDSVKNAYKNREGRMVGSPIGLSSYGYFVNTDLLAKAGYSLSDLTSFEKIAKIATEMVQKNICKYGISFYGSGDEFYDPLVAQGVQVMDQNDGWDGVPTKSLMCEGATYAAIEKQMKIVAQLYKDKIAYSYGAPASTEIIPVFMKGDVGFCMGTNSNGAYYFGAAERSSVKMAYITMPGVDDNAKYRDDPYVMGTGFYICNTGDEDEMQGAYELSKFVATTDLQATWCAKLGYIPFSDDILNSAAYRDEISKYCPSMIDLSTKLKNSTGRSRCAYSTDFDGIVEAGKTLYKQVTSNPSIDIKDAVTKANYTLQTSIETTARRQK